MRVVERLAMLMLIAGLAGIVRMEYAPANAVIHPKVVVLAATTAMIAPSLTSAMGLAVVQVPPILAFLINARFPLTAMERAAAL